MSNKKRCSKCYAETNIDDKFCSYCGSSEFDTIFDDFSNNTYDSHYANQQPQYQNNSDDIGYYTPTMSYQQPKKKGLKGWQIALIVCISIFLFVVVCGIIAITFSSDNDSSDYTKGEIIDNTYINEWANLKFKITDDYPEGNSAAYDTFSDAKTDCGFVSINDLTGELFLLAFEDISSIYVTYTSIDYMNVLIENIEDQLKNNGAEYYIKDCYNTTIAGESYVSKKIVNTSTNMVEYIHVRVCDDYAICLMISSSNESKITKTLKSITTVE